MILHRCLEGEADCPQGQDPPDVLTSKQRMLMQRAGTGRRSNVGGGEY